MNFFLTTLLFALLTNNIIAFYNDCLPCNQVHFQQEICIQEIVADVELKSFNTVNGVTTAVLIVKKSIKGGLVVGEEITAVINNANCIQLVVGQRYIFTGTWNIQNNGYEPCNNMFRISDDVLESYGRGTKRICTCSALADSPENANSTHACFFPVGQSDCYSSWAQCKRNNCHSPCQWHFVNANHTSCEPKIPTS